MSKRKGLSLEEKRDKMVELLQEAAEFFTLKELEKIAPKRKGIVFQSVKEVLQSLVDDGMVSSDKCGVQTVFWCLPSEAVQKVGWSLSSLFTRGTRGGCCWDVRAAARWSLALFVLSCTLDIHSRFVA